MGWARWWGRSGDRPAGSGCGGGRAAGSRDFLPARPSSAAALGTSRLGGARGVSFGCAWRACARSCGSLRGAVVARREPRCQPGCRGTATSGPGTWASVAGSGRHGSCAGLPGSCAGRVWVGGGATGNWGGARCSNPTRGSGDSLGSGVSWSVLLGSAAPFATLGETGRSSREAARRSSSGVGVSALSPAAVGFVNKFPGGVSGHCCAPAAVWSIQPVCWLSLG